MWNAISRLLSEQFGHAEITERHELPGGDVHPAWRLRYGEHDVFMKCNSREMLTLFTWEADQLALLARTQSVRVPAVYGVGHHRDQSFLLLEYIAPQPLDAENAFQLGQQLARLHQWSEQAQFGLDFDNNITTTPQPNSWLRRWSVFFAEQRIGWQLQLAEEKGIAYGNTEEIVNCVQRALATHQPQPSLLHGDLWPANCAGSASGPWLFDPACYWGDRECDLAMLGWFPDLPRQIYEGYQSVWPLPDGFSQRQPVYQLYYLLNRANVFGGSWLSEARFAVARLLEEDALAQRQARPA
ncbi:MAG: fructosamine kinase family protein [Pantoea sp.]|jgi:fructosamine-3-kinase|uniref:fructosamine kinase family protein n=2 Tax=Erwiniaceae TaxID=1903409 RepID=UPI000660DCDD|nr:MULTISPECIES: fructosamine kinase family protein [Pantoea]MBS6436679.1 fructosamine kinase family protein [Pantoea sp.]MDU1572644.1 fructosamine kinase family protein [Pantoea sp.]MDU2727787.1 fructosamine kinase family protein [Pantoea sp.]MDU5472928.1 fructosamine kinase family protein [Pantoea sp.]MDU6078637.1 fructosamine kinase family protein [Pantoea sp.]